MKGRVSITEFSSDADVELIKTSPLFSTADNSGKDSALFGRIVKLPVVVATIGGFYFYCQHMQEEEFNYKKEFGFVACLSLYFLALVDLPLIPSPFPRPHSLFWKLSFLSSVAYQIALVAIFFQTAEDARRLLKHIDSGLGEALEEPSHGEACVLYDVSRPDNPYHNVWLKMDVYVVTHFFGWWLKVLILRDWWISTMISVAFELTEYTLEHQLPYFAECWWDHWILDILLCNGLGIAVGMKTVEYFQLEPYEWRSLWKQSLSSVTKNPGVFEQNESNWESPLPNVFRMFAVVGVIFAFVLAELSTFYLKFVLWIPHNHWLNAVRLLPVLFWGAASLKETFEYLRATSKRRLMGNQTWVLLSIVATEFLIAIKFDYETMMTPIPCGIVSLWVAAFLGFLGWTIWEFEVMRFLTLSSPRAKALFKLKLLETFKWKLDFGNPVKFNANSEVAEIVGVRE